MLFVERYIQTTKFKSSLPNYPKKKIPQLLQGRTDLMREENFNRDPNKQTHTEEKDQLKDSNLLYTSSKEKQDIERNVCSIFRARLVIEFENCCLKRCENYCLKSVVKKRVF